MEKLEAAASLSSTMWQCVQTSANSISQLEGKVRFWEVLGPRGENDCHL